MDAETEIALRKSIAHWKQNAQAKTPEDASVTAKACALCVKFWYDGSSCNGCPVLDKTGFTHCEGSPYFEASKAFRKWEAMPADEYSEADMDDAREEFRKCAEKEVDFLISLLPGGEE
jgi:hypothetical protein